MGYRVVKVPKYVKIEAIKQAERISDYKIECYQEKYTDFIVREVWNIQLKNGKWFEFIPDCEVGNDWHDELYTMKCHINDYLEEIK